MREAELEDQLADAEEYAQALTEDTVTLRARIAELEGALRKACAAVMRQGHGWHECLVCGKGSEVGDKHLMGCPIEMARRAIEGASDE